MKAKYTGSGLKMFSESTTVTHGRHEYVYSYVFTSRNAWQIINFDLVSKDFLNKSGVFSLISKERCQSAVHK